MLNDLMPLGNSLPQPTGKYGINGNSATSVMVGNNQQGCRGASDFFEIVQNPLCLAQRERAHVVDGYH
jgi:hypothetical protein